MLRFTTEPQAEGRGIEPQTRFPGRLLSKQRPEPVRIPSGTSEKAKVKRQEANAYPSSYLCPLPFALSPPTVDLMGVEPITPILQGSVAPNGMEAHIK